VLISDSRQVLFVHVPKTGGVSVEDTVKEACPDARKARPALGRHATLGKILKHEPQVADYWMFGFVRNPWARMVSWYSMISQWDRRHGPASGKPQDVKHGSMRDGNEMWRAAAAYADFSEFVMRGTEELPRVGTPQISYLRAPRHDRQVDFIGRTESFAEDLQRVQVQLGLEPSVPVHKNKSRHGTYHDYFTDETRQRIAEVYAEDVELFGYSY
jgi:hypothetical protein